MLMHLRIAVKDCLLICQSTISQPQLLVVNNNECSAWNITFWSHSNLFIYFTLLYFVFVYLFFIFYLVLVQCICVLSFCFISLFDLIIYYLLLCFYFVFVLHLSFWFYFMFALCYFYVYIYLFYYYYFILYILYFFITKYIINLFLFIKFLVFMLNMFKLAVTCWWRTYVVVNPITGHRRHIWYACTRMMHLVWPLMIKSPEMNLSTGATGP